MLLNWRRYFYFTIASMLTIILLSLAYLSFVRQLGPQLLHPNADPSGQWRAFLADPTLFMRALWNTATSRILNETIGIVGWGDTPLPISMYSAEFFVLSIAIATTAFSFATSTVRSRVLTTFWSQLLFVAGSIISVTLSSILSAFAIYLIANPVGDARDVFIHGRYFVPYLCLLIGGALSPFLAEPLRQRLGRIPAMVAVPVVRTLCVFLLGVMIASYAVTNFALVDRYYLQ
jgi:hypothetical protein